MKLSAASALTALGLTALGIPGLAGCNAPHGAYSQQPIVTTTPPLAANTGPTMSEAGAAPPAFDRNGNANFDSNGTYTGGHGIGTLVDSPEDPTKSMIPNIDAPKINMPDMSNMHCTGSQGVNAGAMTCNSN
jgi:hypothetical protein